MQRVVSAHTQGDNTSWWEDEKTKKKTERRRKKTSNDYWVIQETEEIWTPNKDHLGGRIKRNT